MFAETDKTVRGFTELSGVDKNVLKNTQMQLAMYLQELKGKYKNIQKKYMERVSKIEDPSLIILEEDDKLQFFDQEKSELIEHARYRDESISELAASLNELAEIFKDLGALILHQGTILDRIDYNIEQAVEHTSKGVVQLVKAEQHQRSARASLCVFCLIVIIVILAIIVLFKDS